MLRIWLIFFLSTSAENDLAIIETYTRQTQGFAQSQNYIRSLLLECQSISEIPSIGNQNHMSKKQIKNGFKKIIAGKKKSQQRHYIVYKQNVINNIEIIGFIHTSRDIKLALSDRYLNMRADPKTTPTK